MSQLLIAAHALKFSLFCAVFGAIFAPALNSAQQPAVFSGIVTDLSGAVIPGASVVARSLLTGSQERTVSNGEGGFRFSQLATGDYTITATATGFAPTQEKVTIGVLT